MKLHHKRKPDNNRNSNTRRRFRGQKDHEEKGRDRFPRKEQDESKIVIGVVSKASFGWTLQSTDRREHDTFIIRNPSAAEQRNGELVVAELLSSNKLGRREVAIKECLGSPDDTKNISLIAIHAHGIPNEFRKAAVDEANAAKPVTLGNRTDLRNYPLVTIDGEDARDFDDAVFAERDEVSGGWHLLVAIADVAHYVKSAGALDNDAYERGNSVYFPDRVVPMLPEALCNDLCSLMPKVDRACLAVHMWIDKSGTMQRWQFVRGLMKSVARLTYNQVQAAKDGKPDRTLAPLMDNVIKPLYGAYEALLRARVARGTLEFELPERKVELNEDGTVKAIKQRERLESHKLIEEFMILANVAAASELEKKRTPCMYRVHDKPNEIKLTSLREFLETFDISLMPARQLHPRMLTQILEKVANTPNAQVINEVMLRSQAQAVYSAENIGHFGLALGKYAHFTSPIRRYADLIVHRGLIQANKFGDDGLTPNEIKNIAEIAEHISITERRAATAEREAVDRYTTLFLAERIGDVFEGRISGVARFGLFARLDENGADGIIPFNDLPRDYYTYDEKNQSLVGRRTGRVFQLAQKVKVKLIKADKLTGSMAFTIVEEEGAKESPKKRPNRSDKRKAKRTKG